MANKQPKKNKTKVSDTVISVLLPTRGRREVLKKSIQSLLDKANQKSKVEYGNFHEVKGITRDNVIVDLSLT